MSEQLEGVVTPTKSTESWFPQSMPQLIVFALASTLGLMLISRRRVRKATASGVSFPAGDRHS